MSTRTYPKLKDSGVEWLGKVPQHWEMKRLKTVADVLNGYAFDSSDYSDEGIPIIRIGDIAEPIEWDCVKFFPADSLTSLSRFLLQKGDVMLALTGATIGKCAVFSTDRQAFLNQRVAALRGFSIDQKYLHKIASSEIFNRAIDFLCYGGAQENIGKSQIDNIIFPVPPLAEQRAIADYLDRETARLDTLIARQARLIELSQEKRRALIGHVVTRGLDENAPRKDSGVEWLGEVPQHWEVKRLKNSVEVERNGVWGNEPCEDGNDLICVRVADFDRHSFKVGLEKLTLRNISTSEQKDRVLEPGDLLLEKSGGGDSQPVGCVVLFDHDFKAVCSNFVARLKPSANADSKFFVYLHASLYDGRLNVRSIKQTTGIQNLDSQSYFEERVAFPPLSEQRAIVEYLDRETAKIDELISLARRAIELMKEHRSALIAAAVTGQIDVRPLVAS